MIKSPNNAFKYYRKVIKYFKIKISIAKEYLEIKLNIGNTWSTFDIYNASLNIKSNYINNPVNTTLKFSK